MDENQYSITGKVGEDLEINARVIDMNDVDNIPRELECLVSVSDNTLLGEWELLPKGLGTGDHNERINTMETDGKGTWVVGYDRGYLAISRDDCKTWEPLPKGLTIGQTAVIRSIETDGKGTWVVGLGAGVSISRDNCKTWSTVTGIPRRISNELPRIIVTDGKGTWVIVWRRGGGSISRDDCNTWELLSEKFAEFEGGNEVFGFVTDGRGMWVGVAGTGYIYVSKDNCKTWESKYYKVVNGHNILNYHSLATNGKGLWVAGCPLGYGVFSRDNCETWELLPKEEGSDLKGDTVSIHFDPYGRCVFVCELFDSFVYSLDSFGHLKRSPGYVTELPLKLVYEKMVEDGKGTYLMAAKSGDVFINRSLFIKTKKVKTDNQGFINFSDATTQPINGELTVTVPGHDSKKVLVHFEEVGETDVYFKEIFLSREIIEVGGSVDIYGTLGFNVPEESRLPEYRIDIIEDGEVVRNSDNAFNPLYSFRAPPPFKFLDFGEKRTFQLRIQNTDVISPPITVTAGDPLDPSKFWLSEFNITEKQRWWDKQYFYEFKGKIENNLGITSAYGRNNLDKAFGLNLDLLNAWVAPSEFLLSTQTDPNNPLKAFGNTPFLVLRNGKVLGGAPPYVGSYTGPNVTNFIIYNERPDGGNLATPFNISGVTNHFSLQVLKSDGTPLVNTEVTWTLDRLPGQTHVGKTSKEGYLSGFYTYPSNTLDSTLTINTPEGPVVIKSKTVTNARVSLSTVFTRVNYTDWSLLGIPVVDNFAVLKFNFDNYLKNHKEKNSISLYGLELIDGIYRPVLLETKDTDTEQNVEFSVEVLEPYDYYYAERDAGRDILFQDRFTTSVIVPNSVFLYDNEDPGLPPQEVMTLSELASDSHDIIDGRILGTVGEVLEIHTYVRNGSSGVPGIRCEFFGESNGEEYMITDGESGADGKISFSLPVEFAGEMNMFVRLPDLTPEPLVSNTLTIVFGTPEFKVEYGDFYVTPNPMSANEDFIVKGDVDLDPNSGWQNFQLVDLEDNPIGWGGGMSSSNDYKQLDLQQKLFDNNQPNVYTGKNLKTGDVLKFKVKHSSGKTSGIIEAKIEEPLEGNYHFEEVEIVKNQNYPPKEGESRIYSGVVTSEDGRPCDGHTVTALMDGYTRNSAWFSDKNNYTFSGNVYGEGEQDIYLIHRDKVVGRSTVEPGGESDAPFIIRDLRIMDTLGKNQFTAFLTDRFNYRVGFTLVKKDGTPAGNTNFFITVPGVSNFRFTTNADGTWLSNNVAGPAAGTSFNVRISNVQGTTVNRSIRIPLFPVTTCFFTQTVADKHEELFSGTEVTFSSRFSSSQSGNDHNAPGKHARLVSINPENKRVEHQIVETDTFGMVNAKVKLEEPGKHTFFFESVEDTRVISLFFTYQVIAVPELTGYTLSGITGGPFGETEDGKLKLVGKPGNSLTLSAMVANSANLNVGVPGVPYQIKMGFTVGKAEREDVWERLPRGVNSGATSTSVNRLKTDGKGTWVAVMSDGFAAYTPDDGDTWTPLPKWLNSGATSGHILELETNGKGIWIALCQSGWAAISRDNGVTWSALPRGLSNTSFSSSRSISTDGNGKWVAAFSSSSISVSEDEGATWELVKINDSFPVKVRYINREWVSLFQANGGYCLISKDAKTWEPNAYYLDSGDTTGFGNVYSFTGANNGTVITVFSNGLNSISRDNCRTWKPLVIEGVSEHTSSDEEVVTDNKGNWILRTGYGRIAISRDDCETWRVLPKVLHQELYGKLKCGSVGENGVWMMGETGGNVVRLKDPYETYEGVTNSKGEISFGRLMESDLRGELHVIIPWSLTNRGSKSETILFDFTDLWIEV